MKKKLPILKEKKLLQIQEPSDETSVVETLQNENEELKQLLSKLQTAVDIFTKFLSSWDHREDYYGSELFEAYELVKAARTK